MSIKRTFTDFHNFHTNLVKLFPELKRAIKSKLRLQTTLRDNMTNLFAKDKRGLAESREQMIDFYLVNLLKQPERIRASNTVLSFFEPTESDPKPCKSSSPDTKSDSGIDLTNDRVAKTISDMTTSTGSDDRQSSRSYREEYDTDDDYEGDTSGTERTVTLLMRTTSSMSASMNLCYNLLKTWIYLTLNLLLGAQILISFLIY
ncbi:hypothetical protein EB796_020985 [Bugula neritina]|uniref:PX domain-containing protein n=1 Tax=Bugula neritina TaxID=10212 RepID=A0A7J7J3P0_BUGNE|nr:hypothetical protein EB796_020985 [Bugula neritina]